MDTQRKWLDVDLQKTVLRQRLFSWLRLVYLAIFAVYFYVFMEWLFFITKPSFLDNLGFYAKMEVLCISALILSGICLVFLLALLGLSTIPWISKYWYLFLWVGGVFPVLFLSVNSLLLFDNFTYTLFQFGIVSMVGVFRVLYGLLFALLFAGWFKWVLRQIKTQNIRFQKDRSLFLQSILCIGMLSISIVFAAEGLETAIQATPLAEAKNSQKRPHIILFGGDGLNAMNMSAYGYERDTTPNLRKLAETSFVAENAFTNSANSAGSVTSILTGKLPITTRVVYNPDILRGKDAFLHLPGILRSAGYLTVEIATSYYVDAQILNFQEGFDMVNQRSAYQGGLNAVFTQLPHQNSSYFLRTIAGRIIDRLLHIFFIRDMPDSYGEVTGNQVLSTDQERIDQLMEVLSQADRPIFIHIHLMTTHGPIFQTRQQVFSAGQNQNAEWMADFYDDSILDFDAYAGEMLDGLTDAGLLDQTLVIIYSDHNQGYKTDQRIPLMFHFPNGALVGRLQNNAQNIDIAPTILDYLELPIPDWMDGKSLISGEISPTRPIYSTGVNRVAIDKNTYRWAIDTEWLHPPFYQFGFFRTVVCQYSYYIDLTTIDWSLKIIDGHTRPCASQSLPDGSTILRAAIERLKVDGFDVIQLEALLADTEKTLK